MDTTHTDTMLMDTTLVIGSELVEGGGDPLLDVNPATEELIAEVPTATSAQVDGAVAAARAALDGEWGALDPFSRRRSMTEFGNAVIAASGEIGTLQSQEMGMPLGMAMGDAMAMGDYILHFSGHADKIRGAVVPTPVMDAHTYTVPEPVGVVAAFPAFNSPSSLTGFKLGPALAAGCTVVLKAPDLAPLAVLRIARIAAETLPAGVVNCVTGGPDVGSSLVEHPDVDKVTFTGGGTVGSIIGQAAIRDFKRVTLELGGKSANIVFPDADLDAAAVGACQGTFWLSGQQCVAGSRLFLHTDIHDEFLGKLEALASGYLPGDPSQFETTVGPIASKGGLERIESYVNEARESGADVLTGGLRLTDGQYAKGYWYPPTIVTGVSNDDRICQEEVFGPVVTVVPFDSEDEVVKQANASRYGLAGGVWTRDLSRAHRVARRIRTGTVWVNCYTMFTPGAPFGGVRSSGIGREGGVEAVQEFVEWKTVHMAGIHDA